MDRHCNFFKNVILFSFTDIKQFGFDKGQGWCFCIDPTYHLNWKVVDDIVGHETRIQIQIQTQTQIQIQTQQ